jgi:RNA polymerase-binding transcription factor DksA
MNKDFSPEFIEARKKELLKIKRRVEDEISHISECSLKPDEECRAKFPNYGNKEEDNATEVGVYEDFTSLETSLNKLRDEVNTALTKIEKGTYGECENCQGLIPEARLEAFPAAPFCIKCEKKRK